MAIEAPGDLLLPEPEEQKEVDLYRALKDNSVQVRNALNELGDRENKVKASSSDPTADYLDGKVDGTTIQVSSNTLSTVDGGINHNSLLNTHNLTTDIDHDQLTNTHNLTTDIDHDQLTNYSASEHFTMIDDDTFATASATTAASSESIKAYVDNNIEQPLSNVVFQYAANVGQAGSGKGEVANSSLNPGAVSGTYRYLQTNNTSSYETLVASKWRKIAGVSTWTVYCQLWVDADPAGTQQSSCQMDVGGQTGNVTTADGITTPTWYNFTVDVSSLSDGTVYDVSLQLKHPFVTNSNQAYCGNVIALGS